MDHITAGILVGGIVGGPAGGLGVLLIAILQKPKKCPECGEALPKYRKPKNHRQTLWGGWTCEEYGCEIDRTGRKIAEGK